MKRNKKKGKRIGTHAQTPKGGGKPREVDVGAACSSMNQEGVRQPHQLKGSLLFLEKIRRARKGRVPPNHSGSSI